MADISRKCGHSVTFAAVSIVSQIATAVLCGWLDCQDTRVNHSEQRLKGQMMANSKRASAIQQTEDLTSEKLLAQWTNGQRLDNIKKLSWLTTEIKYKVTSRLSGYFWYLVCFCKYFKVTSLDHIQITTDHRVDVFLCHTKHPSPRSPLSMQQFLPKFYFLREFPHYCCWGRANRAVFIRHNLNHRS